MFVDTRRHPENRDATVITFWSIVVYPIHSDLPDRDRFLPQRSQSRLSICTCKSQLCSRSGYSFRKYYYCRKCYTRRCQRNRCWVRPRDQTDRRNDSRLDDSRRSVPCRTRAFPLDIRLRRCSTVQRWGPECNRARRSPWTRICKISPRLIRAARLFYRLTILRVPV